jgi:hypothetical protein
MCYRYHKNARFVADESVNFPFLSFYFWESAKVISLHPNLNNTPEEQILMSKKNEFLKKSPTNISRQNKWRYLSK